MSVKEYYKPQSLEDAVGLLAKHGQSLLVMAGGTVAMPLINDGISFPEQVMSLKQAGLDYILHTNGSVLIGAATPLSRLIDLDDIPLLQAAARHTASWSIRNLATAGGNLFTPPPGGDVATALLALDATVKLVASGRSRTMPLAEFYTGFMTNQLQPDELLAEIQVPVSSGEMVFLKYGRKHSNTPAMVAVAARLIRDHGTILEARIALNGVGPHPILANQAASHLIGTELNEPAIAEAAQLAADHCQAFTDALASETYRRKMVRVFVSRALAQLAGKETH